MREPRQRNLPRTHLQLALEIAHRQSRQGDPVTRLRWRLLYWRLRFRLRRLTWAAILRWLDRQALTGWHRLRYRGDVCPIRRGQASVDRSTPSPQYHPGRF